MTNLPPDELKQIALDLHRGLIFTDRHLLQPDMLPAVFMPLLFLGQPQRDALKANPPGLIFEYRHKAGSWDIDGAPMFLSLQMLSPADTEKVLDIYQKLQQAEQAALSE